MRRRSSSAACANRRRETLQLSTELESSRSTTLPSVEHLPPSQVAIDPTPHRAARQRLRAAREPVSAPPAGCDLTLRTPRILRVGLTRTRALRLIAIRVGMRQARQSSLRARRGGERPRDPRRDRERQRRDDRRHDHRPRSSARLVLIHCAHSDEGTVGKRGQDRPGKQRRKTAALQTSRLRRTPSGQHRCENTARVVAKPSELERVPGSRPHPRLTT